MTEVWKEIKPGLEVSSEGRVRRYLTGHRDADGYLCVSNGARGLGKTPIHRLVALAFLGPAPAGKVVRHLSDNKDDNRVANLRYGTRKENAADAKRNGKLEYLTSARNLARLKTIAKKGGAWWRGKKRKGVRGKLA